MSYFFKYLQYQYKIKSKDFFLYCLLIILYLISLVIFGVVFRVLWIVSLPVGVISLIIVYIILWYNGRKTYINLDTLKLQNKYHEQTGLSARKSKHFTRKYKKWLVNKAINDFIKEEFVSKKKPRENLCCIYCCFWIVPILFMGMFTGIYFSPEYYWVPYLIILLAIPSIYLLIIKYSNKVDFKKFESEIQRVLYEEETGYKPLKKGKLTRKYKYWLVKDEK